MLCELPPQAINSSLRKFEMEATVHDSGGLLHPFAGVEP